MVHIQNPASALALVLWAFSVTFSHAEDAPSPQIVVQTADDRSLRGVVDERSDGQTLWIRQMEGDVVLTTPVDWQDLAAASLDGVQFGLVDLREQLTELASAGPRLSELIAAKPQAAAENIGHLMPRPGVVRNLEIVAAGLVNLDRDVEPDGVEVTIVAVGYDGLPMAVRGSLRAELHGERRSVGDPTPRFEELGRWTQRVQSEDFVDGAATYCLPFRTVSPEFEFDVLPDAVITVQLGATGHGNFSASAPVAVRLFNPLRDDLQQWEGTRFLPNEVRGREPRALSVRATQGMWQWWGR
jgi:hypothetical protein